MDFKTNVFNVDWNVTVNIDDKKVTSISFEFNSKQFKIPIEDVFKMFDKYKVDE